MSKVAVESATTYSRFTRSLWRTIPGGANPSGDIAPVAWLINSDWLKTHIEAASILTDDLRYIKQTTRHPMRIVDWLDRSAIFSDFFEKLHRNT